MGKKRWRQGIEMPEFSGKSWKDLNDVWPIDKRTTSDSWYLLAAFQPAYIFTKRFTETLLGVKFVKVEFSYQDVMCLAWCLRCEEAKGGLCTEEIAFSKGTNEGMPAFWRRKAFITKIGLIENIPTGTYTKAYRVTEKGRIVLKKFVEMIDECHTKLREDWSVDRPPYDKKKPIDAWIKACTKVVEKPKEEEVIKPFEIND